MPTSTKPASSAPKGTDITSLKSSASSTASTASTTSSSASSAAPATPHYTPTPGAPTTTADIVGDNASDPGSEEEHNLRAYSKELYTYTLDLLNAVRIEGAQRRSGSGVAATAGSVAAAAAAASAETGQHGLKRTVSDVGVVPVPVLGKGSATAAAAVGGKPAKAK